MEGRDHTGVLLVLNSSADPTRADEWNRWYVDTHLPETLRTGAFGSGSRFRLSAGYELPSEATNAALYETTLPSTREAMEKLGKAIAAQPLTAGPLSNRALVATYTKIASCGDATGKRANGIALVMTNCTDPSAEDEFNAWYNDVHLQHVLDNMDHYAVTRYVADNPKPWQAKYLAVYETESHDPGKVVHEGNEWFFRKNHPTPPSMSLWCEAAMEREV